MLRRVEQVNRTAERVIAGNLSDRVPRRGTNDEFDQLAANLNGMLDQIERLMTGMREVTDNVAHDLKTPLARLRARLELALLGPGDTAAQSEAIRAAIDEADRLLATFNALLSIAEAEAGSAAPKPANRSTSPRSPARVVELYEPVAEEKGFALRLDGAPGRDDPRRPPPVVAGGCQPARQRAQIWRERRWRRDYGRGRRGEGGRAVLEVGDRGPGIPEGDREAVFDRFVRLEPSRSTPGNGLGLSLVRAVARRHGGSVTVDAAADQPAPGSQGAARIPGMVADESNACLRRLVVDAVVDPPAGSDHHVAEALRIEPGAAQHRRHDVVRRAVLRGSAHSGSNRCVRP